VKLSTKPSTLGACTSSIRTDQFRLGSRHFREAARPHATVIWRVMRASSWPAPLSKPALGVAWKSSLEMCLSMGGLTATLTAPAARGRFRFFACPGWMIGSKVISISLTLTASRGWPNGIPESAWWLSRRVSESQKRLCSIGRARWRRLFRVLHPCHCAVGPPRRACDPRLCRVDSIANSVCRQSNFDWRHEQGVHGWKSCDRLER